MESQKCEFNLIPKSSQATQLISTSSASSALNDINVTNDERCQVSNHSDYDVNKMVLCKHFDNLYYEAKIIGIQQMDNGETGYKVHYQGWNRRHDEVISYSDATVRFLPFTHENCLEAKARLKAAQENMRSKKKVKKNMKADEGKDGSYNLIVANKKGICKQTEIAVTGKSGTFSSKRKLPIVENLQLKRIRAEATPSVSVKIPVYLKDIIVEDQTKILDNRRLVRLPARFPVDVIISRVSFQ
uniref:MRG domain-containing protein n=1 Tax=Syphacia muris TaxID=451379 RepID=A0A0N5ACD7_9BILA